MKLLLIITSSILIGFSVLNCIGIYYLLSWLMNKKKRHQENIKLGLFKRKVARKPVGRQSKLTPAVLQEIKARFNKGESNKQIHNSLRISSATYYKGLSLIKQQVKELNGKVDTK